MVSVLCSIVASLRCTFYQHWAFQKYTDRYVLQAVTVSRQVGAMTYVETSAKTSSKAVKDAFEVAALAALGKLN